MTWHERHTMSERLLTIISDTGDRRKPRVVFADGGSVLIWIVPPH